MQLLNKRSGAPCPHTGRHTHVAQVTAPVLPAHKCPAVDFAIHQQDCIQHAPRPARSRRRGAVRLAARGKTAAPAEDTQSEVDADTEDSGAASSRAPRDQKFTGPEILERAGPAHPYPAQYQQTLISSFTLSGVGLHTGEAVVVRVRPAFAGEGRYFVHVEPGTNEGRQEVEPTIEVSLEEGGQSPIDPELEEKKLFLFKEYLIAQEDEGFNGTFKQYLHHVDAEDLLRRYQEGEDVQAQEWDFAEPEEIVPRGEGEGISADIDSIHVPAAVTVTLGDLSDLSKAVIGVELLLAALEACGVDNARIEIEGGMELPQLDGSALGWAMEIQFAGLRAAPCKDDGQGGVLREAVLFPGEPFMVTEGDAYISFVPENNMRVTAGLDHHLVSEAVGKQWKSWSIYEDLPFRFDLAGARRWLPAFEHLQIMGAYGFFQGVTEGTVNIAEDDKWMDEQNIRYVHDEAARFEVMLTIGCLALAAKPGHSGLPFGHVTCYKATPDLRLKFVRELRKRVTDDMWTPVWDVPLNIDPEEEKVQALMEFQRLQVQDLLRDRFNDPNLQYGEKVEFEEADEDEWAEEGEEEEGAEEGEDEAERSR